MRTENIKIYLFDELSEEAQINAIENWRVNGNAFDEYDGDMLTESFKEQLVEFGYDSRVNIEWSLSSRQGDGVAFYGVLDFSKWIQVQENRDKFTGDEIRRLNWLEGYHGIKLKTVKNSYGYHYSHWNTMEVEVFCDYDNVDYYTRDYKLIEDVLSKLEYKVRDTVQDLSVRLENEGYTAIEYNYSDEAIRDCLISNLYEFLEDGTMY